MKVGEWLKNMDNIEIDDDLDQERNNLDPSEELELIELKGDNDSNWLITMGRCPLKVYKSDANYGCSLKLLLHWNDTEYLFRH